ncbi:MAG: diacylglycerol kinase family lipid kinase [Halioglobus sp.]|nr:diacylglycerol kinase family lipid kinase [Halioglobus sp.]
MRDTEYCVIVNPAAAGGKARRKWPALEKKLTAAGVRLRVFDAEQYGDCETPAREGFEQGLRHFIAVGGDGTANGVINGVLPLCPDDETQITLGVVPWGTGNDWANFHGLSGEMEDCVKLMAEGVVRHQDIGRVAYTNTAGDRATHYFLNMAGTGFDTHLLDAMGPTKGSRLRYLWTLLRVYRSYRAAAVTAHLEGETLTLSPLLFEVCLGSYIGAGMLIAPDADGSDGLFDILAIEQMSTWKMLRSLKYLYNGDIDAHPATHARRCDSLTVDGNSQRFFQCDGELVGTLPINIDLLPLRLRILSPP